MNRSSCDYDGMNNAKNIFDGHGDYIPDEVTQSLICQPRVNFRRFLILHTRKTHIRNLTRTGGHPSLIY